MSELTPSPWLFQLNRQRPVSELATHAQTDVAIVGAGISGVVTAFFTLKYTDKKVVLVEAGKVAHGATGHNAGQITSYFERPFQDIVREFGLPMAAAGQVAVDTAWQFIEEIYADAKLTAPFSQFIGYAGLATWKDLDTHLADIALQAEAGAGEETVLVAKEAGDPEGVLANYPGLYTVVPHAEILTLLQSKDSDYFALLSKRKGCLNSALFTEELVGYLLSTYPQRFILAEHAPVQVVELTASCGRLHIGDKTVVAENIVLCTNGFEKFEIKNLLGADLSAQFHRLVRGVVGYMAGYLDELNEPPIAISYMPKNSAAAAEGETDSYYYLTRRPFPMHAGSRHTLVCIGGPEALMDDTNQYRPDHPYPTEAQAEIDAFMRRTYNPAPANIEYRFLWHGLMGFTPTNLRVVGPEPRNPVLLYNLGCNGVGILPSLFGGRTIARHLAGEDVPKSIFSPQ